MFKEKGKKPSLQKDQFLLQMGSTRILYLCIYFFCSVYKRTNFFCKSFPVSLLKHAAEAEKFKIKFSFFPSYGIPVNLDETDRKDGLPG